MSPLLERVIKAARALPENQLGEVLKFVSDLKRKGVDNTTSQAPSQKTLLEISQQEGLIDEFPNLDLEEEPDLDPIPYTGKPLSEIIIEDRGPK